MEPLSAISGTVGGRCGSQLDGEGAAAPPALPRAARRDPRRAPAPPARACRHARARARARRLAQHGARRRTSSSSPRATPRRARGSGTYVAEALPRTRAGARRERARRSRAGPCAEPAAARRRRAAARSTARAAPGRATWSLPREPPALRLPLRRAGLRRSPARDLVRACSAGARGAASARALAYQRAGRRAPSCARRSPATSRARAASSATPEQILIVHGSQQAIDLVARLLVDPGDARRARGAALHRLLVLPRARSARELATRPASTSRASASTSSRTSSARGSPA